MIFDPPAFWSTWWIASALLNLQLLKHFQVDDFKCFQWQMWVTMLYSAAGLWNTPRSYFQHHHAGVLSVLHTHVQDWERCSLFPFLKPSKKTWFPLVLKKYSKYFQVQKFLTAVAVVVLLLIKIIAVVWIVIVILIVIVVIKELVLAGISLIFFPAAGSGWNRADNTGMS